MKIRLNVLLCLSQVFLPVAFAQSPDLPVRLVGSLAKDPCAEALRNRIGQAVIRSTSGVHSVRALNVAELLDRDPELKNSPGFQSVLKQAFDHPFPADTEFARMIATYFPKHTALADPLVAFSRRVLHVRPRELVACMLEGPSVQLTQGYCAAYHLEFPAHFTVFEEGLASAAELPKAGGAQVVTMPDADTEHSFLFLRDSDLHQTDLHHRAIEFFQVLSVDYTLNLVADWLRVAREREARGGSSFIDLLYYNPEVVTKRPEDPNSRTVLNPAFFMLYLHGNRLISRLSAVQILDPIQGDVGRQSRELISLLGSASREARRAVLDTSGGAELLEHGIPGICPGPIADVLACAHNVSNAMFNAIRHQDL